MKRLIALLLLCGLLLGGCASPDAPATEPAPTLAPPKEYTVTAGGVSVKTDYSAYTTGKTTVTPHFTRLTEEALPELEARDDYGRLYPFSAMIGGSDYFQMRMTGFADAQGRIVADPVYSYINLLSGADGTQGLWLYKKTEASEYTDTNGETYPVGDTLCGLASLDGSFVTGCRYAEVSAADDFLLCIYPSEDSRAERFDVYDYAGTLLKTEADFDFTSRLGGYSWQLTCAGDLLVVPLKNGKLADWGDGTQEETDSYLYRLDGTCVAGPYSNIYPAADGFFSATLTDGGETLLKPDGSPLFDRDYYSVSICTTDRFLVMDSEDGDKRVVDAAGNVLITAANYDSLFWDGAYFVRNGLDGDFDTTYDIDGNPLTEETAFDPDAPDGGYTWYRLDGTNISAKSGDVVTKLYNTETGQKLSLDLGTGGYVAPCCYLPDVEFPYFIAVIGQEGQNYEKNQRTTIYNEQFEPVLQFVGTCHASYDTVGPTAYLTVQTGGTTTLYDATMTPFMTLPGDFSDGLLIFDGVVSCYDTRASYIYDTDGTELFCLPLYTLLAD